MKIKMGVIILSVLVAAVVPPTRTTAQSVLQGGQKQLYSVQMRSDGQSIVYAKLLFEAQGVDNLESYTFSLPSGVTVNSLSVQQILAKKAAPACTTYETIDEWRKRQPGSAVPSDAQYNSGRKCLVYDNATYDADYDFVQNTPDGNTDYYYPAYYKLRQSSFEYKDITPEVSGQRYTLKLPEAIKPTKQGALLVSFISKSYVSGGLLGYFDYNFRTLTSDQMIETATVAVNFDEDLYSRGASQTREVSTTSDISNQKGSATSNGVSYRSPSLDQTQQSIGQGGQIIKTQSKMLPGDTLAVKGAFATNKIALFGKEIFYSLLAIALLVGGAWRYHTYRKQHPKATKTVSAPAKASSGSSAPLRHLLASTEHSQLSLGRMVSVSLISIVSTAAALVAVLGLSNIVAALPQVVPGMVVLVTVIVVGILLLIVAPVIYMLMHGPEKAFQWVLLHVSIIVIVALLFLIIAGNITAEPPTVYPADCITC